MRKIGSVDKVLHRKTRNDKGKKRKRYAGNPCKHRSPSYYNRRITNKDTIKIRPLWRVPMSRQGYKNWNVRIRPRVNKEVTNMKMSQVFEVKVTEIDSKKKMEEFIATTKWPGKFVVMGISHGKTKTHRKWVKLCTIIVKETINGNVGNMIENKRLYRYWFYKG